jgi:hypothetical protein
MADRSIDRSEARYSIDETKRTRHAQAIHRYQDMIQQRIEDERWAEQCEREKRQTLRDQGLGRPR